MLRKNAFAVTDLIVPKHVLVSTFGKDGLENLVPGLLRFNPDIMFYSSTGTGKKVQEILGEKAADNYLSIEEFTGSPEMEGGLVKTLHPKIHAGLLAERGNPAHEKYLFETMAQFGKGPGVYFDIFVGNLYPFEEAIAKKDANAETARINIDIGGPGMTMAACKNWHSVSVLSDPVQYDAFLVMLSIDGAVKASDRFCLAQDALLRIGQYRQANASYFAGLSFEKDVLPTIELV